MPYHLDDIDVKIIEHLQQDGRMASAEIARKIGYVTERVVRHRIKRLVEEQIIQIAAVINPESIGYNIKADVWVETVAGESQRIAHALAEMDQVSYLAFSTGDRNISLQISTTSIQELHRLVTEVIGNISGVRRTSMNIIPDVIKDVHQWQLPADVVNGGKEVRRTQK